MLFFFFFEQTKWDHSPIPNAEAGLAANILTNNSSQIGNLTVNDLCDKRKNCRVIKLVIVVVIHILALDQVYQT